MPLDEQALGQKLKTSFDAGDLPGLHGAIVARALYLFQNGKDTLYRIHGTSEPWTIGTEASSGCIRMLKEDVIELYGKVSKGATVVVL